MSQDRLRDKRRSNHATNYTNKVKICTLCDDVSFRRKFIMAAKIAILSDSVDWFDSS